MERFDGGAALALLPNFAYSLALARFWAEKQQQQRGGGGGSSASAADKASTSAAAIVENEEEDDEMGGSGGGAAASSHDTLVSAMLLHPLVVPQMMGRLQGQGVGRDAYWGALLERRLFSGATNGGSATLGHLVSLYVERSHLLWKGQDVQVGREWWRLVGVDLVGRVVGSVVLPSLTFNGMARVNPNHPNYLIIRPQGWMRRAADAAADAADKNKPPPTAAATAAAAGPPPLSAEDWAAVARESFPETDANEFSHLRLADFSDAVNALPREEVAAAMEGGGGMEGLQVRFGQA